MCRDQATSFCLLMLIFCIQCAQSNGGGGGGEARENWGGKVR